MTESRPVTLVAIDGPSLNFNLSKKAHSLQLRGRDLPKNSGRPRLRLDYLKLADLLASQDDEKDIVINYYTAQREPTPSDFEMGKVVSFKLEEGRGFIAGARGGHFEFNSNDVMQSDRQKLFKQIVNFELHDLDDERAVNIQVVSGASVDNYYRLRREFYFNMLRESGYQIVRCRPSRNPSPGNKAKSVDCRIYYDALDNLSDEIDQFVLLSDDPNFSFLIQGLAGYGIVVTLATFDTAASRELRDVVKSVGGEVILLDRHLMDIQLEVETVAV